jgi:hypothetical protein
MLNESGKESGALSKGYFLNNQEFFLSEVKRKECALKQLGHALF